MNTTSPTQLWMKTPAWYGFVLGVLGGFAASTLLIGLVVGYSMSNGMPSFAGPGAPPVADNPAAPTPPAAPAPSGTMAPVTAKDHLRGNKNAKITLVEYSDFECPFCKRHAPTMNAVAAAYKDDVNVVFRHFPLSFHQNAKKEAEASECVAELGGNDAFWKFHDAIFERTTSNGTGFALDKLGPLAKEVGVDQTKFQSCLDSGKYAKLVDDQEQGGIDGGVQGTPGTFVVNNQTKETKMISGAVPLSSFQTAIDAMLGKKS